MFVTNWISTTKIQKISEITNFFRHYFLSRTEVYTAFNNTKYSSWVVTDVYVLVYPQNPTESVIQVKQGSRRYSLVFSQDGGLLHEKDISNGDDTIWPPAE